MDAMVSHFEVRLLIPVTVLGLRQSSLSPLLLSCIPIAGLQISRSLRTVTALMLVSEKGAFPSHRACRDCHYLVKNKTCFPCGLETAGELQ